MEDDKPLVTMSMMTYNQEKYVRESVKGLLSQTYDPLEIVISDDCSTDKTWDIICEEVDRYQTAGGTHTIVLNHNDINMGIVAHAQKMHHFKHGIISIGCGGDDISFPERAERIVQAWEASARKASYIYHASIWIDERERRIKVDRRPSLNTPWGAVAAIVRYPEKESRFRFHTFGEGNKYIWDDWVEAFRTRFRGSAVGIADPLIYYRIGGISSSARKYREPIIRAYKANLEGIKQAWKDFDLNREQIDKEKADEIIHYLYAEERRTNVRLELMDGKSLKIRWNAFRRVYPQFKFARYYFIELLLVLPRWIGDPLLNQYHRLKLLVQRLTFREPIRHK